MESAVQIAETTEVLPDRSGYISRKLKGEEKKRAKRGKKSPSTYLQGERRKTKEKKREGKKGKKIQPSNNPPLHDRSDTEV